MFLDDNKYRIQEKVITVPKKKFVVSPSLSWTIIIANQNQVKEISQRRSQLLQVTQIVFRSQNKLANTFHFKDRIPKELISGVVYKF